MARKRREPSPPPPPPPPQAESSEESGSDDEDEGSQKKPQNPGPSAPDAAARGDDGGSSEEDEGSDSDADAQDFQLRQVIRSPGKPPAPQPQRRAPEEEEESGASESEPEIPDPVQKKTAAEAAAKASRKSKAEEDRKRPATPEPAPSGKAKKAKSDAGNASPELTPTGKAKNPGSKVEKAKHDPSPSSKSEKGKRPPRWSKGDDMKILEAIAGHIKTDGAVPKTDTLISLVAGRLDRESCGYTDMYEKVRTLKKRYQKVLDTGVLPSNQDDIEVYNLSDAVWGEKAKEAIAAATTQTGVDAKKSKKGQGNKERVNEIPKDGTPNNANIDTASQNDGAPKASKRGREKGKTDRNVKSRIVKEATTTATPVSSKKQGSQKEGLDGAAKGGMSKETTTTATQNGDAFTRSKKGKTDTEKADKDMESLMPKESATATQNGIAAPKSKEGETHDEETETYASVRGVQRDFDELQILYPSLATCVEGIEGRHPCGETLKRAFEFIDDEKARNLDSLIQKQRIAEAKSQIHRADITKQVFNLLISLVN